MNSFGIEERRSETGAQEERPTGVPTKFSADGIVQPFPGNTIICHLASNTELFARLEALYEALGRRPRGLFTLLPPSSWHMTVFEGVCDQVRKPDFWPTDLPDDAPLAECNDHFARKLSAFRTQTPSPFRLNVSGYTPRINGIGLHLEPENDAENRRLRDLRDRLAHLLQIRHPDHEAYGFHLSIAYFIRFPSADERDELDRLLFTHLQDLPKTFELGSPEFCYFDDMFEFRRQFFLK